MKRKLNYDKLITLRTFLGDPVNQFVNLANSLSKHPAKKVKKNKQVGWATGGFGTTGSGKKKKSKKYLQRRREVEIEDISDGNL